jgi:hypothetical protein
MSTETTIHISQQGKIREALREGEGIVRLAPCWVPRSFMLPGGRHRLDPKDLYSFGANLGGINERWFASTTKSSNGQGTGETEGVSFIAYNDSSLLLRDAIETRGDEFLGPAVMEKQGGWNLLCKFFDNLGPIPHHLHQNDEMAAKVGQRGKPEAYYFPPQYNVKENHFPLTFMGLEPGTTKDDVRRCLERWSEGDNGILYHSKAYRLQPGSGWQINAGVLHAPGSLVTYEPQVNSDVFAMFQSMVDGRTIGWDLLVKDVPAEFHHDLDYLIGLIDWKANVDHEFARHNRVFPKFVKTSGEMMESGYIEKWVTYGTAYYSAKELTILPGREALIKDGAAYGLILTQGHGRIGRFEVETPSLIKFGEMTSDELFVSAAAAANGVHIQNPSQTQPLVILKHFGPGNPEAEQFVSRA